jgi:hypothetical protein
MITGQASHGWIPRQGDVVDNHILNDWVTGLRQLNKFAAVYTNDNPPPLDALFPSGHPLGSIYGGNNPLLMYLEEWSEKSAFSTNTFTTAKADYDTAGVTTTTVSYPLSASTAKPSAAFSGYYQGTDPDDPFGTFYYSGQSVTTKVGAVAHNYVFDPSSTLEGSAQLYVMGQELIAPYGGAITYDDYGSGITDTEPVFAALGAGFTLQLGSTFVDVGALVATSPATWPASAYPYTTESTRGYRVKHYTFVVDFSGEFKWS